MYSFTGMLFTVSAFGPWWWWGRSCSLDVTASLAASSERYGNEMAVALTRGGESCRVIIWVSRGRRSQSRVSLGNKSILSHLDLQLCVCSCSSRGNYFLA